MTNDRKLPDLISVAVAEIEMRALAGARIEQFEKFIRDAASTIARTYRLSENEVCTLFAAIFESRRPQLAAQLEAGIRELKKLSER